MPLPTDPLLNNANYLINSSVVEPDLNVAGVWNPAMGPAYTGAGITVAVAGDGFDYNHEDLAANYLTSADFDFLDSDSDPFGLATDIRGTMFLGIIGADNNTVGSVGVAYDSSLIGYRTQTTASLAQITTWVNHVEGVLAAAAVNADILNFSYGLNRTAGAQYTLLANSLEQAELATAINSAVDTGRDGAGLIIVQGAGNFGDDTNTYGMTNDTRIIVVASVGLLDGNATPTSGHGASVLVSGIASPTTIITTDRTGAAGFDTGNYTGFSAGVADDYTAAAMVSGVVALMLDANSTLGWRDVQTILAYSARHTGTDVGQGFSGGENAAWLFNGATNWNGGGLHHSLNYGYGLVDATAAVRLAETWFLGAGTAQTSANEETITSDLLDTPVAVQNDFIVATTTLTQNMTIERVAISMTFDTTWLADMRITLIAPDGTRYLVTENQAGGNDFNGTWTFELQSLRGVSTTGTWQVEVVDFALADILNIQDIQLSFHGSTEINDRYIFSDEFSDYGALNQITDIDDTDGGIDVVNAAMVTTNSCIFLDGRISLIDTMRTTFNGVENAIGGDGNDSITGNVAGNEIWGGRGRDTLNGAEGVDRLFGESGNDSVLGGDGNDQLFGGEGNDTLYGEATTTIPLTTSDDILDAGAGNDFVYAGTGNDLIYAGSGNDYMDGGTGTNDIVSYINELAPVETGLISFQPVIGGALGDTLVNIEGLEGTNFGDRLWGDFGVNVIRGLDGFDILYGFDGNDSLYGGDSDDWLLGGLNADLLDGGNGALDAANYGLSFVGVNASLATPGTNTGEAAGDIYVSIEVLIGSEHNDTLTGDAGANRLFGGTPILGSGPGGDDLLDGGASSDSLFGEGGNDTLIGGAGADGLAGGDGTMDIASYRTAVAGVRAVLPGSGSNTGDAAGDVYVDIEGLEGSNHADTLVGDSSANELRGLDGNDVLDGGALIDSLFGGSGNDTLIGGSAQDSLFGGVGTMDIASYITALSGVQALLGSPASNTGDAAGDSYTDIEGLEGSALSDTLGGNNADNRILGDAGNDQITGLAGNDTLDGGDGNDTLIGGVGSDVLTGGLGTADLVAYWDSVTGLRADLTTASTNTGIAAGDTYSGIENLAGTNANDTLVGNAGANAINGFAGDDVMEGRDGNDTLNASDGNDTLIGGNGADELLAGNGTRDMAAYWDVAAGGVTARLDVFGANTGAATGDLYVGIEDLGGSNQSDVLVGSTGGNVLLGFGGNDTIFAGDGNDTVQGGTGNDSIFGNGGNDLLVGEAGLDVFIFNATLGAANVDTIQSYVVADDTIQLENAIFTALTATGTLAASAFVIGAAATTAAHRIIYNSANGQLLYDADGTNGIAAVHFATLSAGLFITEADFVVI